MNIEKVILLLIEFSGGSIIGKTLLQKQMYFLSVVLKEDFGFRPHYYGPYSPEVDDNLLKLKALGFVNETILSYGFADSSGFDVKAFQYTISTSGKEVLDNYKNNNETEYKRIFKHIQKLGKNDNFKESMSLSIAAKTYYIVNHSGRTNINDIKGMAEKYGWHNISANAINNAISFLTTLKLVK